MILRRMLAGLIIVAALLATGCHHCRHCCWRPFRCAHHGCASDCCTACGYSPVTDVVLAPPVVPGPVPRPVPILGDDVGR